MHTPRRDHGLAELKGKLYAVGGYALGEYLATVEIFEPAVGKWVHGPSMRTARASFGLASVDGKLYAAGGSSATMPPSKYRMSSVEVLDPAVGEWAPVPSMISARDAHGLAAFEGKLYAAGGYTNADPF